MRKLTNHVLKTNLFPSNSNQKKKIEAKKNRELKQSSRSNPSERLFTAENLYPVKDWKEKQKQLSAEIDSISYEKQNPKGQNKAKGGELEVDPKSNN